MTLQTKHGPLTYRRIYPTYNRHREVRPPGVELAREVRTGGAFELLALDKPRRLRFLGIGRSQNIPIWSSKLWISAPEGGQISRMLAEGGTSINTLLTAGVSDIEHNGRELIFRWTPYRAELDGVTTFPFLEAAGEAMAKLAPLLERIYPREQPVGGGYLFAKRFLSSPFAMLIDVLLFMGSSVVAALSSIAFTPVVFGDWFRDCALASAALLAVYYGFVRYLAQRYCLVAGRYQAFLLFGAMTTLPLAWSLVTLSNAWLDHEPSMQHRLPITHIKESTDKHGTVHYKAKAALDDGPGEISKSISQRDYVRLDNGEQASLVTFIHPGFWGLRWAGNTALEWKAE